MNKTLDALLWACAGSQLTFYLVMLSMQDVLRDDVTNVSIAQIGLAADQFWTLWWWGVALAIGVGAIAIFLRWRAGEARG